MINLGIDKKSRVVVAMSGGVDSSVAAALVKQAGYDVIGLTMQLYDQSIDLAKAGACCAGIDIYDAKKVAEQLNIPHYVLNYESKFKEQVINDFVDSYSRGETPIPCVRCNQTVKFKDMLGMAKELGAQALVTGHYARVVNGPNGREIRKGIDESKDQSYFLFTTTKEQLDFIHFPLGEIDKLTTRKIANDLGLATADKPDSQDICFVPNGKYADVVRKYNPSAIDPGEVVHVDGRVLGYHSGIINFTIGQRKGLGVSVGEPIYVVRIEPETKRVIVGTKENLDKVSFKIKELNWLSSSKIIDGQVKVRYNQTPIPANVRVVSDSEAIVTLNTPTHAITPGQACVIYNDDRLFGGGFITREIN